jgi:multidrug transporter EmrE-like cation transporter
MSPVTRTVTLAILLSGLGVAADAALKMASLRRSPCTSLWFVWGCALLLVFAVVWIHVVQQMKLATAGLIYGVTSTLLLVVVGALCFRERLSASEITGVAMAMGAMMLLRRVLG